MNEIVDQLAQLKLHGMAQTATSLLSLKKTPTLVKALQQLIEAEVTEREVRGIRYQTRMARFPHHKDFASFDHSASAVSKNMLAPFISGQFTQKAHHLILVGGTGTGQTHIAIALGMQLIQQRKKVCFFNAVDLINALIAQQQEQQQGKLIRALL